MRATSSPSSIRPPPLLLHSLNIHHHHHQSISHTDQLAQLHAKSITTHIFTNKPHTTHTSLTMDQAKEFLEMPREFVKDGRQFITRCSKRTSSLPISLRSEKQHRKKRAGSIRPLGIASPAFEANRNDPIISLLSVPATRTQALDPDTTMYKSANVPLLSQPTSASSCAFPRPSAWAS